MLRFEKGERITIVLELEKLIKKEGEGVTTRRKWIKRGSDLSRMKKVDAEDPIVLQDEYEVRM